MVTFRSFFISPHYTNFDMISFCLSCNVFNNLCLQISISPISIRFESSRVKFVSCPNLISCI